MPEMKLSTGTAAELYAEAGKQHIRFRWPFADTSRAAADTLESYGYGRGIPPEAFSEIAYRGKKLFG